MLIGLNVVVKDMKKILPLIFAAILFSCDNEPEHEGSIRITETSAGYKENPSGSQYKYLNSFAASVINTTHAPVKGHVRFEIKEYGYINSSTETVTNEKGFQKTFFATLETDKIIDESYLLKAEFVRE